MEVDDGVICIGDVLGIGSLVGSSPAHFLFVPTVILVAAGVVLIKRYLINYPFLLIMGRQYFVFLVRQGTEQPHQGDVNNISSFLIHPRRYAIRTK